MCQCDHSRRKMGFIPGTFHSPVTFPPPLILYWSQKDNYIYINFNPTSSFSFPDVCLSQWNGLYYLYRHCQSPSTWIRQHSKLQAYCNSRFKLFIFHSKDEHTCTCTVSIKLSWMQECHYMIFWIYIYNIHFKLKESYILFRSICTQIL